MHIPDNYLSPSTCAVMTAAVVPAWAVSLKRIKAQIPRTKLPLLGVGAAFSFLVMMFNVPLPGGTTGHAVGGTLLSILFGPWAACLSVSMALLLQALLFGDGGILAFGANCFNIAFVLPFVGHYVYRLLAGRVKSERGRLLAAGVGSYVGLNAAALFTALEFGIQPLLFRGADGLALYCPYPLWVSIPAMLLPHLAVAGFVEAVFTAAVFGFVRRTSPGMVLEGDEGGARAQWKPAVFLLMAMTVLTPLGLLAEGTAWGEWGGDEIAQVVSGGSALGYTPAGMADGFEFGALMPDYTVGTMPEWLGYILAAVIGAALLVILFKIACSMRRKDSRQAG